MSKLTKLWIAVVALMLSGCANQVWIADWKATSSFSAPRAGTATVIVKDKLYLMGGVDGTNFVNFTEYAQIQKDGTLGPWQLGQPLNEERGFMEAVVHGDYVYIVGGGNGAFGHHLLRSIERARILDDGQLGQGLQLTAHVPTRELLRYAVELRSMTGGRGRFTVSHDHYDVLPSHLVDVARAEFAGTSRRAG